MTPFKKIIFAATLLFAVPALSQTKVQLTTNTSGLVSLKKLKSSIDEYVYKHQKNILVFAKIAGKKSVIQEKNENWPDDVEYTYNIIKTDSGRIIMIAQMPYSESGDWYVEYKHYFDASGKTFAFSKRGTVFNDSVKGGVAVEEFLTFYDNFRPLSQTSRLTDKDDKVIKRNKNEFDFREFEYRIYKNLNDCLKGFNIQLR